MWWGGLKICPSKQDILDNKFFLCLKLDLKHIFDFFTDLFNNSTNS